MKIASPKLVRSRLLDYAQRPHDEITRGDRGAIVGAFETALEGIPGNISETENKRHLVWGFCFGAKENPLSLFRSANLSEGHFFALKKWIGFYKDDDDQWAHRREFFFEVRQVYSLAEVIYQLDQLTTGEAKELLSWLDEWEETQTEIEDDGMVQSAVGSMGGMVQDAPPPPDNFTGKPDKPLTKTKQTSDEFQPEEGWVPL